MSEFYSAEECKVKVGQRVLLPFSSKVELTVLVRQFRFQSLAKIELSTILFPVYCGLARARSQSDICTLFVVLLFSQYIVAFLLRPSSGPYYR